MADTVSKGKALVAKLRANPKVRDAEALAANLGRRKKLRSAGVAGKKAAALAAKKGGMKEGGASRSSRADKGRKLAGKSGGFDSRGFVGTGNLPRRNSKAEAMEDALKYYEGGGEDRAVYVYELHGKNKTVMKDFGGGPAPVETTDKAYVAVPRKSDVVKKIEGTSFRDSRGGVVDSVRKREAKDRRDESDRVKAKITETSGGVQIKTPYNREFADAVKKIGGRWNRDDKAWTVPKNREKELRELRDKYFK